MQIKRVIRGWKNPSLFTPPVGQFEINHAGSGRRILPIKSSALLKEAFASIGIERFVESDLTRCFIGNHFEDGAFVHPHIDHTMQGFMHVRCNWMLRKPPVGGDPIIDGGLLVVDEGDLWVCVVNRELHASTPIAGGERLTLSLGALVEANDLHVI